MSKRRSPQRRRVRSGKTARSRAQKAKVGQYKRIWRSRGFVVGLIILIVLISVSVVKEAYRRVETRNEIAQLEQEVAALQNRNTEISEAIALLQTSSHSEKEARVKLGLQKEGERVIILPGNSPDGEIQLPTEPSDSSLSEDSTPKKSNPQKWMDFFRNNYSNT